MERRTFSYRLYLILLAICIVLILGSLVAVLVSHQRSSQVNSKNNDDTNAAPIDPALSWSSFVYRPFGIVAPVPTGMQVCVNVDQGFVIRNDECAAQTKPTFSITSNSAWDTMDAAAVFNDVYGQELREAGILDIAQKAVPEGGKPVAYLRYTLSDALTGIVVFENLNNTQSGRKFAVTVRRNVPPIISTVAADVDVATASFLAHVAFLSKDQ